MSALVSEAGDGERVSTIVSERVAEGDADPPNLCRVLIMPLPSAASG